MQELTLSPVKRDNIDLKKANNCRSEKANLLDRTTMYLFLQAFEMKNSTAMLQVR